MTDYDLVTETAKIYAQRREKFGSLVDIFVGKEPLKPITTLLSYCKRNAIIPKSLELMTFNLDNSIKYLKEHYEDIKGLDITLIGAGDISEDMYEDGDFKVTIKRTNKILTEHINIIHSEDDKTFIWHEPFHIVDKVGDFFGYEDGDEKDENNLASERLRARLYEPSEKQLANINVDIKNLLVA